MSETKHWDKFWKQGYVTSFAAQLPDNYEGNIASHWHSVFSKAPENPHVLDLATGNGAIAFLAGKFFSANGGEFTISAVDAARIGPEIYAKKNKADKNRITFYEKTPIESMPFPSNHFDLACSQFGFEYCDLKGGSREVARVLKPQSVLALVCHSDSSKIHVACQEEFRAYQLVLNKYQLFELLKQFALASKNFTSPNDLPALQKSEECEAIRNQLNSVMTEIHTNYQKNTICQYSAQLLRNFFSQYLFSNYEDKIDLVESAESEIIAAAARLKDQLDATIDTDRHHHLVGHMKESGLELRTRHKLADSDNEEIGVTYIFQKVI